jgi:thiamine pyrophosphate-dependent acetolactate synthase large subunit-like protein
VAEGLGCEGIYVDAREQIEPALERARASAGPTVVCAATSRDANMAVPPAPALRFAEVYQGPIG